MVSWKCSHAEKKIMAEMIEVETKFKARKLNRQAVQPDSFSLPYSLSFSFRNFSTQPEAFILRKCPTMVYFYIFNCVACICAL